MRSLIVTGLKGLLLMLLAGRAFGDIHPPSLIDLGLVQQAIVSAGIGAHDVRYHAQIHDRDGYLFESPHQGFEAILVPEGLTVRNRSGSETVGMRLDAWGCDARLEPVPLPRLEAHANEVSLLRHRLKEWYVHGPLGLEQGFTVKAPGPGCQTAPRLVLRLQLEGAEPTDLAGDSLLFPAAGIRYRGLYAFDAKGQELAAQIKQADQEMRIVVDVDDATWPVVVDPIFESAKLNASDSFSLDRFGTSVAVSGDTIAVGAPGDNDNGSNSGSAYVFIEPATGWNGTLNESAKLLPSDGGSDQQFGVSVAISGDTIVVGTPLDDDNGLRSGSAYVFVEPSGGWNGVLNENAKLLPSDGIRAERFGTSVAISGDTIAAGMPFDDLLVPGTPNDSGSAYVFSEPSGGWNGTLSESAKLLPSDGSSTDLFGFSVAVSGGTIIVGSRFDDDNGADSGSAYVFSAPSGGWNGTLNEDAKLLPRDGNSGGQFGFSVAVSMDTVVVGAPDVGLPPHSGAAYVFVEPAGGWNGLLNENAELLATDLSVSDKFGSAVAIDNTQIVVGAPFNNLFSSPSPGVAYVYVEPSGGWAGTLIENVQLLPSEGGPPTRFGFSTSVSGSTFVVGQLYDEDFGPSTHTGSAYVFAAAPQAPDFVKTFTPAQVATGDLVTLTFVLDNSAGLHNFTDLTFTDDLNAFLNGAEATDLPATDVCGSGSKLAGTSVVTLTGGRLNAGGRCSFDLVIQIPEGTTPGVFVNTTTALEGDDGSGPRTLVSEGAQDQLLVTTSLEAIPILGAHTLALLVTLLALAGLWIVRQG